MFVSQKTKNKEGQKKREKKRRKKSKFLAGGELLVPGRIQLVCFDLINSEGKKTNWRVFVCLCSAALLFVLLRSV